MTRCWIANIIEIEIKNTHPRASRTRISPKIIKKIKKRTRSRDQNLDDEGEESLGQMEHCNTKEEKDNAALNPLFLAL